MEEKGEVGETVEVEETVEDVQRNIEIKKDMVRKEIDTNPYLMTLRILLSDKEFVNASKINKESIVEEYVEYDSSTSVGVDVNYILETTISIIKQVSEEMHGLVYGLDGLKNTKLSREQQEILNSNRSDDEKVYKMFESDLFKSKANEKVFSSGEAANLFQKLGMQNAEDEEKKLGKEIINTFIESESDKNIFILSYKLVNANSEEERNKILKEIEETCKDSKFYEQFKDENGKFTIDSVNKGREKWEIERNDQDIKIKISEFARKVETYGSFDSLSLDDKKRLIKVLYRANDPEDVTTTKMAEELAKKYGLNVFDKKTGKLSDDFLKTMYNSLLDKKYTNTELEEMLNSDEFDKENAVDAIKELERMPTEKEKMQVKSYEDILKIKALFRMVKFEKINFAKKKKTKNNLSKKEIISRKEMHILRNLYGSNIDFSDEKNQLALIKYYAVLSRDNQGNSAVHKISENGVVYGNEVRGSSADIIKKFIIENPQYFGNFINDSEFINNNQVKEVYKNGKIDFKDIEAKLEIDKVEQLLGKSGKDKFLRLEDGKIVRARGWQKEEFRKTEEEILVEEITRKLRFPVEVNAVTFAATYAMLKYFDTQDVRTSEKEKEINKRICDAMENVITHRKNKSYFKSYLDENGQIIKERIVKSIDDASDNMFNEENKKDKSKSITIGDLIDIIDEFKIENGIDKIKYNYKARDKKKKEEREKKEKTENKKNEIKDKNTTGVENKKDGSSLLKIIVEKGKDLFDNLSSTVKRFLLSKKQLALQSGEEGIEISGEQGNVVVTQEVAKTYKGNNGMDHIVLTDEQKAEIERANREAINKNQSGSGDMKVAQAGSKATTVNEAFIIGE